MIAHGLPIYMALEPVDMRRGAERLGALVRERMRAEPRSRALFVFVGKRGHSMKILTWDGTGTIVVQEARRRAVRTAARDAARRAAPAGERRDLRCDPQRRRGHAARVATTNSLIEVEENACTLDP